MPIQFDLAYFGHLCRSDLNPRDPLRRSELEFPPLALGAPPPGDLSMVCVRARVAAKTLIDVAIDSAASDGIVCRTRLRSNAA